MEIVAVFVTGLLTWTFVEYVIHAWLSHTFRTFATPFHEGHHRDPHNVFAIRTWLPLALIAIVSIALWGSASGVIFFIGIMSGFVLYEWLHYRIHFAVSRSRLERWLRTRHLIHHNNAPHCCFGVTSSLWDLVFGSDLKAADMKRLSAATAAMQPLSGPTNVRKIFRVFLTPWRFASN